MDKVFQTILNMSLTGAFVIAAVCLARLALKKAPKIISYCLWAVVGFRLLCPLSIESALSLIPFEPEPIQSPFAGMPYTITGYTDIRDGGMVDTNAPSYYDGSPDIAIVALGSFLWSAGLSVMLLYGVISYILLKRRMRTAIRVEGNLYETDNIPSPFVLGIIKPKIYLPLSLADGEREYIILHERTHIRRYDHIVKFAAYFILCLHWFNPLCWVAFLLMGVDMEMSCDERVLKELGSNIKHDYSRSLLSLNSRLAPRAALGAASRCPLAFSEGGLKQRIKNVLNFRKPSRVIIVVAVALVAVLSVGFAVNRIERKPPQMNDLAFSGLTWHENTTNATRLAAQADFNEFTDVLGKIKFSEKPINKPDYSHTEGWYTVFGESSGETFDIVIGENNYIHLGSVFGDVYFNIENPQELRMWLDEMKTASALIIDTVSIIVWKDDNGQTRYSLFDGDVTPAPSELSGGRVYNDIADLNAALAEYPQDTLSMAFIKQTIDFTKDEGAAITESIKLPSGNYSKATGFYDFDRTLPETEPKETTPPVRAVETTLHEAIPSPTQIVYQELLDAGCKIEYVFLMSAADRKSLQGVDNGELATIYASYTEGEYGDAIYCMRYDFERPTKNAQWTHTEPTYWDGIALDVAAYVARTYYSERYGADYGSLVLTWAGTEEAERLFPDMDVNSIAAFTVGTGDDPPSSIILTSPDGQSHWKVIAFEGETVNFT